MHRRRHPHDANSAKRVVPEDEELLDRTVRKYSDGRFRAECDDLKVALIQRLGSIDRDHISRGLYSSSGRLSVRLAAQTDYLRAVLAARVQSIVDGYEAAGAQMGDQGLGLLLADLWSICKQEKAEFTRNARAEADKSRLGQEGRKQLLASVTQHCGWELRRSSDLANAERARLSLINKRNEAKRGVASDTALDDRHRTPRAEPPTSPQPDPNAPAGDDALERAPVAEAAGTTADVGAARDSSSSWTITFQRNRKRRLRFAHILWVDPRTSERVEAKIGGPSQVGLIALVFSQPDEDLTWTALLSMALARGYVAAASSDSLRRIGIAVSKSLPARLRGYWAQSGSSVRWNSPPGFERLYFLPLAEEPAS